MLKIRISDLIAEMKSVSIYSDKEENTPNVNLFGVSYLCFTADRVFDKLYGDDPEVSFDKLKFQSELLRMLTEIYNTELEDEIIDFESLEFGFDDLIAPEDLLNFTNIGFAEMFGETPSHLKIDVYKFRYDGDGKTITSIHRYASRLGMLLEILRTQGDQEIVFC
jgi:hypothetical protein